MTSQILLDADWKPHLFRWAGPVDELQLAAWLQRRGEDVPVQLVDFWLKTGGGEVFESEMMLHPLDLTSDDSIENVERYHHGRGLPEGHLPFHEGACGLSVVRSKDAAYLNLDDRTYQLRGSYASFDDWYRRVIRKEFAARYGLPILAGAPWN